MPSKPLTPEQKKAKAIQRSPWKYCKVCQVEIKSRTGFCHEHWKGDQWTASPYGLVNVKPGGYRLTPSERR